jgi:hypothetical protein
MREKKQWRKAIDQGELSKHLEKAAEARDHEKKQSSIPDSELFKVSSKPPTELRKQREKLKADRFK